MSINFLDLETTDLDPRKGQIWEVGVIRRRHGVDTEFLWQFAVDLDRANHRSLEVGQFHDRFVVPEGWEAARLDPATGQVVQRLTLGEALFDFQRLWEWEDDRPVTHMVGAVPSFDDGYLKVLFAEQQKRVCWHYHLVCAENLAAGCLGLEPPWDSDDLSRAMGVDPGRYLRHSAIGDCRLVRDIYDAVMARKMPSPNQLSVAEVADWLAKELEFGVGMHTESPPPWLTVRDLAAAWQRLEGAETVEDWVGTIEAETGWSVVDTNPDHALTVPTSEHTVTVPGYGEAVVAEVAGAWNWRCDRQGCGIGAVCILTVEQAESSARWHLEHEHDPLPADDQRHSDDVATQVRRDENARSFVTLAEPNQTATEETNHHA